MEPPEPIPPRLIESVLPLYRLKKPLKKGEQFYERMRQHPPLSLYL